MAHAVRVINRHLVASLFVSTEQMITCGQAQGQLLLSMTARACNFIGRLHSPLGRENCRRYSSNRGAAISEGAAADAGAQLCRLLEHRLSGP